MENANEKSLVLKMFDRMKIVLKTIFWFILNFQYSLGYKPSFAFYTNNETAWYPSWWGIHDNNDDWIAYEFTVAVRVHGIRMVVDKDDSTAQPKKVIVEASDKM